MILLSSRPDYHRRFYYCFHNAVPRSRSASSHYGTTVQLQTTEFALGDAYPLHVVPRSYTCQGVHPFATADAHVFHRLLREPPHSKLLQVVER